MQQIDHKSWKELASGAMTEQNRRYFMLGFEAAVRGQEAARKIRLKELKITGLLTLCLLAAMPIIYYLDSIFGLAPAKFLFWRLFAMMSTF